MVLIIMTGITLHGQIFLGGFKGGICGSQVSGDRLSGFDKFGIHGGLYAGLSVSEKSRVQLEMSYVQKGSRQNPKPDRGIYGSYILKLNYIELPLMFVWRGNSFLELEGGLSYGYLMRNTDVEYDENGLLPGMTPFRKYDISLQLGLNYLLSESFMINFRLNNSILPIREHAGGATYLLNLGQYNTVLMLGVNYLFGQD